MHNGLGPVFFSTTGQIWAEFGPAPNQAGIEYLWEFMFMIWFLFGDFVQMGESFILWGMLWIWVQCEPQANPDTPVMILKLNQEKNSLYSMYK